MEKLRNWVCLIGMGLGSLLPISESRADTIPSALRGKSLAVAWTDDRMIKDPSGAERQVTQKSAINIYVSDVGRVFSRFDRSTGPRRDATSISQVSGVGAKDLHWHFDGNNLIADWPFTKGARRVVIGFGDGFNSCSTNVIHGKAAGSNAITYKGSNDGVIYEIISIRVTSTSCALRPGNVFESP
jgi:hypothetical protein